jgi:hypothetical protein
VRFGAHRLIQSCLEHTGVTGRETRRQPPRRTLNIRSCRDSRVQLPRIGWRTAVAISRRRTSRLVHRLPNRSLTSKRAFGARARLRAEPGRRPSPGLPVHECASLNWPHLEPWCWPEGAPLSTYQRSLRRSATAEPTVVGSAVEPLLCDPGGDLRT